MNDACVRARRRPRPRPLMDGQAPVPAPVSAGLRLAGVGALGTGHRGGLAVYPSWSVQRGWVLLLTPSTDGHY